LVTNTLGLKEVGLGFKFLKPGAVGPLYVLETNRGNAKVI